LDNAWAILERHGKKRAQGRPEKMKEIDPDGWLI